MRSRFLLNTTPSAVMLEVLRYCSEKATSRTPSSASVLLPRTDFDLGWTVLRSGKNESRVPFEKSAAPAELSVDRSIALPDASSREYLCD